MACHYSACGDERACIGYVAQEGYRNLNVRLMVHRGELNMRAIDDACAELDLWPSFEQMLRAYERALRTPTRKPPRR
jgi:hypothetical protein